MKSEMNNGMIGAIVGDIAGSWFEWHNRKTKRYSNEVPYNSNRFSNFFF
jgi:hypothetical protein